MARRTTSGTKPTTRGRLSRERILTTALAIVDDDGLSGLTIRRLAADLDVTAMAVYRHFRNKAEILDGLIEVVVEESQATEHDTEGWREWIIETFMRMRKALVAHPEVLPLMGTSASYGVHSLRIAEEVLGMLRTAGLSDRAVARGLHVLISYTFGAVAIEVAALEQQRSAQTDMTEWQRQLRLRFESANISEFPNLVALAPALARFVRTDEFQDGLMRVIDGFSAELDRPATFSDGADNQGSNHE